MASPYRSWADRRQIIRSIIADAAPPPLAGFGLSPSEEVYFRARSDRMIDRLARRTSSFKTYYQLRTSQPFLYVVGLTLVIVTFGVAAGIYMYLRREQEVHLYPLLGASATLSVAAVGWCVAGWIAHRNAVRQNTNNILFARFSQTAFMESMHRFHREFGAYAPATKRARWPPNRSTTS